MKPTTLNDKRHEAIKMIAKNMGFITFYFSERNELEINYKSEDNKKNGGITYLGAVNPIFDATNKTIPIAYEFQGKRYTILLDAINAIHAYNETLTFPPYCYQNSMRKMFRVQGMIIWYMENVVGFQYKTTFHYGSDIWGLIFVRKDIFDSERYKLNITFSHSWDYDGENPCVGRIGYDISDYHWIQSDFSDINDFKQKISGFVEPMFLIENIKNCDFFLKTSEVNKNYNVTEMAIDSSLNVHARQMRNATKEVLQNALRHIEKQEEIEKGDTNTTKN